MRLPLCFLRFRRCISTSRSLYTETMANNKYAKLPKVELHVHGDGACRLETLRDLAEKYDRPYPYHDIEQFKNCVCLPKAVASLTEFLKVFDALSDILRTEEALDRVAYEYCEDAARQNVVYAEYRFNPFLASQDILTPEQYCEGVFSGLERGQKEFGIKVRSILCFLRNDPANCLNVVRLAERYRNRGVVGVDIAGDELLPMDPRFVAGFQEAKKLGLHITVHAAESGPAANVQEAIEVLGAERIGHGYHVIDDEVVYQLAMSTGVHFEVCPTSSRFTSAATVDDHAVKRFAADKVSFSLNTDDPGVMLCDLNGEYLVAEGELGLSKKQIVKSVLDGAKAAFLPDEEKQELIRTIQQKLDKFHEE